MSNLNKYFVFKRIRFLCGLFLIFLLECAPAPAPSGENKTPIDIISGRETELFMSAETLKTVISNIDFTIKLKASYIIGAIVLSKKGYSNAWQGKMVPYDLYKKIKWWQEVRYDNNFSKDNTFILTGGAHQRPRMILVMAL